jgi:hypothetical protein
VTISEVLADFEEIGDRAQKLCWNFTAFAFVYGPKLSDGGW